MAQDSEATVSDEPATGDQPSGGASFLLKFGLSSITSG